MATLSAEKQAELVKEYDKWMAVAKKGLPDLGKESETDGKSPDESKAWYKARADKIAAYHANPGVAIIEQTRVEVIGESGYPIDDKGALIGAYAARNEKIINDEVERRLVDKRAAFIKGLEDGAKPDLSKAMAHFQKWEFSDGIMEAIKSIGIVGDILSVIPTMIGALFAGKPMGPMAAFGYLRTDRALTGGFEALGITDGKTIKAFSAIAMNHSVADVAEEPNKKGESKKQDGPEKTDKPEKSEPEKGESEKPKIAAKPTSIDPDSIAGPAEMLKTMGVGLRASTVVTGPIGNVLGGLASIAGSMLTVEANAKTPTAVAASKPDSSKEK